MGIASYIMTYSNNMAAVFIVPICSICKVNRCLTLSGPLPRCGQAWRLRCLCYSHLTGEAMLELGHYVADGLKLFGRSIESCKGALTIYSFAIFEGGASQLKI